MKRLLLCLLVLALPLSALSFTKGETRAYYKKIVEFANTYKAPVLKCAETQQTLVGCNSGRHGIPPEFHSSSGPVKSLVVINNGTIVATPNPAHGVKASDLYYLTGNAGRYPDQFYFTCTGPGVNKGYTSSC